MKKKLRSASSVNEIQEIGSQLGMEFTEDTAKEYLEIILQNEPKSKVSPPPNNCEDGSNYKQ